MIRRTIPQKTISNEVELNGVGLHTGVFANMKIYPARPNTGINFKRVDI